MGLENELGEKLEFYIQQYQEELQRNLQLNTALCNMLFAFSCFEERGLEQYPEEMQEQLREYYHKAREAFVGHELPREPKGVLVDLGEFRKGFGHHAS
jgi:hypothetical protein